MWKKGDTVWSWHRCRKYHLNTFHLKKSVFLKRRLFDLRRRFRKNYSINRSETLIFSTSMAVVETRIIFFRFFFLSKK